MKGSVFNICHLFPNGKEDSLLDSNIIPSDPCLLSFFISTLTEPNKLPDLLSQSIRSVTKRQTSLQPNLNAVALLELVR